MIAIGILTTWLTLTAAGFAGLSALGRSGAREDIRETLTPSVPEAPTLADMRVPIPKALLQ
jgi:hypothetical protein